MCKNDPDASDERFLEGNGKLALIVAISLARFDILPSLLYVPT